MTKPNNCDLLLDYYNLSLEDDQMKNFEQHLSECSRCQEEYEELVSLTEELAYSSTPVDPPVGMKDRILSNVFAEETEHTLTMVNQETIQENNDYALPRKKKNWMVGALAAALLLSLVGNFYTISLTNQTAEEVETPLDQLVKEVVLQATTNPNFSGTASIVEKNGLSHLIVKANGLSAVKENEVYQVWLLKDGTPYRAGSFIPNQDGSGMVTYQVDSDLNVDWDTVAITLEPTINSELPLGEVVLASEL
ncbi:anti-sigma factor [Bacillus pinisoli]|uniref:anti-sigma factor n=1 Tax=Bacillus pinisoli TaxID=2901866 RepID=UPI001FF1578E|nr:anti-sigma factor [Bacillus pinisoli]